MKKPEYHYHIGTDAHDMDIEYQTDTDLAHNNAVDLCNAYFKELIDEEKLEEIISATMIGRAIPLKDNKIITASDVRLAIQVNAMDIAKAIADELRSKL